MVKTVYLAGNIAGLKYEDATIWRTKVADELSKMGYKCLDPMRGKSHLAGQVVGFVHDSANCSAAEIFKRDIEDIKACDVIFTYITGFSIGTAFEIGYAFAKGKTVIVVAQGAVEGHPFLTESASFYTNNITAAIEYLRELVVDLPEQLKAMIRTPEEEEEITDFLWEDQELIPIALEISSKIKQDFPDAQIQLKLDIDYEYSSVRKLLFLIGVEVEYADSAYARLAQLENNLWMDKCYPNKILIMVDLLESRVSDTIVLG